MRLRNQRQQSGVGLRARSWRTASPGVITADRHPKGGAQLPNRVFAAHGFYPLETVSGGVERMPKVFFNISRCRIRLWFSRRSRRFSSWSCSRVGEGPAGIGTASCCFQVSSVWLLMPNSWATALADLPLPSQCSTALRLKFSSYRFFRTFGSFGVSFMACLSNSHAHTLVVHKTEARP